MSRRDEVYKILCEFSWYCAEYCQDTDETTERIMALFPEALPIPQAEAAKFDCKTHGKSEYTVAYSEDASMGNGCPECLHEAYLISTEEAESVRDETLDASDKALGISDIIANQGSLK